jgi:twitching motility protein PilT
MAKIDTLLLAMKGNDASDLFMHVGQKPKYSIHGEVVDIAAHPVLTKESMGAYLFEIIREDQKNTYLENLDFDFAYGIPGEARFRVNYFFQRTGYGSVMRIIPDTIMSLEELSLPPVLKKFTEIRDGLVLVTGPTGSGKSTTLAAMIDHINNGYRRHVLTIEDPVEFVHQNKNCMISHREVNNHTESFAAALRSSTRQDADVVLVGELRDVETMGLALSASSMGTLVYGTLHTNNAPKTIDRVIDVFPTDQQAQIRTMLGESLRGIVAQQLLKKVGGGRVAVNEILVGSSAVANMIREGKIDRIMSVIQAGRSEGMQAMDDELDKKVKEGIITGEDAYMKALDKKRFEQYATEM